MDERERQIQHERQILDNNIAKAGFDFGKAHPYITAEEAAELGQIFTKALIIAAEAETALGLMRTEQQVFAKEALAKIDALAPKPRYDF